MLWRSELGLPHRHRRRAGAAAGDARRADEFAAIASPVGLALALETLAVESTYMGRGPEEQAGQAAPAGAALRAVWGGIGAVAEAFGVAWDAAGDRPAAIAWLDRAVQADDASASIKALQTLQNLRARQAWAEASAAADRAAPATPRAQRAGPADDAASAQVQAALHGMQALVAAQETTERLNLLGSAYKRAALLARKAGRTDDERASLAASLAAYARAEVRAAASGAADLFYPALNRIGLELALHGGQAGWPGLDAQATAAARASLIDAVAQRPDFWGHVNQVEFDMYDAVAGAALARRRDDLLAGFEAVHARVRTAGMWESVATQAELVLEAYAGRATPAEAKAAQALLQRLRRYARPEGDKA